MVERCLRGDTFSSNTGLDLDVVEKKLHELNEFGREKMDWSN
jgi:hypothetical protein